MGMLHLPAFIALTLSVHVFTYVGAPRALPGGGQIYSRTTAGVHRRGPYGEYTDTYSSDDPQAGSIDDFWARNSVNGANRGVPVSFSSSRNRPTERPPADSQLDGILRQLSTVLSPGMMNSITYGPNPSSAQSPFDYSQISRGRPTQYDGTPISSSGRKPQNGNQARRYDWPTPYSGQLTPYSGQPTPYSGQPTPYGSRPRPNSDQPTTYEGGTETTDEYGNTVITTPMSEEMLRESLKEQNFAPSMSPTAVVRVEGRNKKTTLARIMIDTGASECLISQRVAAKLELRQEHLEASDRVHTGIGGNKRALAAATLKLCSRHSSYCLEVHCDIVEQIAEGTDTIFDPRTIPTKLPLAEDGTFETKNPITDVLVGAEYFPKLYLHQPQQISGFPHLYKTEFGYVAIGKGELGTRYMILKEEPVVQTTIMRMPANQYY